MNPNLVSLLSFYLVTISNQKEWNLIIIQYIVQINVVLVFHSELPKVSSFNKVYLQFAIVLLGVYRGYPLTHGTRHTNLPFDRVRHLINGRICKMAEAAIRKY